MLFFEGGGAFYTLLLSLPLLYATDKDLTVNVYLSISISVVSGQLGAVNYFSISVYLP